jgi:hypothetical protein
MKKSFRTIALMSTLTVAAAPVMRAEPLGTNPRPQITISAAATLAYTILAYFGL